MHLVRFEESRWGARPGLPPAPDGSTPVTDGQGRKAEYLVLQASEPGEPTRFQMALVRYPEGRGYPRHRHKTDQIRLVLAGSEPYGPDLAAPVGSILYLSSGTLYGPAVRTAGEEFLSIEHYGADATFFAEGPVGPRGLLAQCRYSAPIEICPANFVGRSVAPGVSERRLGTFTERGCRLTMLDLDGGASHELTADQPSLAFVTAGTGGLGGAPLGPRDSWRAEPGESCLLRADTALELFLVGLPALAPLPR